MPKIYFSGLNGSRIIVKEIKEDKATMTATDRFFPLSDEDITDIEIGWDYLLIWKDSELYVSGKPNSGETEENQDRMLKIPENPGLKYDGNDLIIDL